MSEENDTKQIDQREMIFNNAFFAALTGLAGRAAGQDPGTIVNEAYVLAERSAERFFTDAPVLTDAQRIAAVHDAIAAQGAGGGQGQAGKPIVSGNATQMGGVFQRPAASTP